MESKETLSLGEMEGTQFGAQTLFKPRLGRAWVKISSRRALYTWVYIGEVLVRYMQHYVQFVPLFFQPFSLKGNIGAKPNSVNIKLSQKY